MLCERVDSGSDTAVAVSTPRMMMAVVGISEAKARSIAQTSTNAPIAHHLEWIAWMTMYATAMAHAAAVSGFERTLLSWISMFQIVGRQKGCKKGVGGAGYV